MPIRIEFLSDVRAAVAGVKDYGEALEEVGPALDGLARDSAGAGDQLERNLKDAADETEKAHKKAADSLAHNYAKGARKAGDALEDAAKDGERSADKLADSFKDASDATAVASKRGADQLASNTASGTSRAKADLAELGNEARQNAAETFSSFDGSAESFADGIQGTLGGIVSSLGPLGAAAGAAGALGIGIIIAKMAEGEESSEAFKARVSELGDELIATGNNGEASLEYILDKLRELATTTEDGVVNLEQLQDAVEGAGQGKNFEDIARAVAGSGDALDDVLDKQREYLEQLEEESQLADQSKTGSYQAAISKALDQQLIVDELEKAATAAEGARAQEEAWLAAGGPEMEAKAARIENINDAYDDAAGAVDDYIDEESGIFDTQAYIDAMAAKEQALVDYQNTLATTSLTPAAKAFIDSQGVESAATFLAGYKTATPAQQAELNRIWSEAGKTSSGSFAGSTQASLSQAGFNASVKLNTNPGAIQTALDSRNYSVSVQARVQNNIQNQLPARQGMGVP